nr:MAG TPA: Pre-mRNA branch site protein p14 mutant, pre-mRNA splicing, adenine [Caudoviricetes sp.]
METKTNADRIREMTDEELAKLLKSGTFICGRLKDV